MSTVVRENTTSTPLHTAGTDWANINLPDAWPDQIASNWRRIAMVISNMVRKKVQRVQLPEDMPGRDRLPKYLLQEFHHLPNGNYSKTISRGYANSFNKAMLGSMTVARAEIARRLVDCKRVLDIGCGAGHLTGAMQSAGIDKIWALEPSPYLLQHAARDYPGANFVQGVIENSGLPSASFDGAAACFVFHEIPPPQANAALRELSRLMVPGAKGPEQERAVNCALGAFTKMKELRPDDARGEQLYVQTLFDADRFDTLIAMYEGQLKSDPNNMSAINSLINVHSRADHWQRP